MSLTLKDLRVRESDPVFAVTRPASLADLVEVLADLIREEGVALAVTEAAWEVLDSQEGNNAHLRMTAALLAAFDGWLSAVKDERALDGTTPK